MIVSGTFLLLRSKSSVYLQTAITSKTIFGLIVYQSAGRYIEKKMKPGIHTNKVLFSGDFMVQIALRGKNRDDSGDRSATNDRSLSRFFTSALGSS